MAVFAALLAAALTMAGCGSSSGGANDSAASDAKAAPAGAPAAGGKADTGAGVADTGKGTGSASGATAPATYLVRTARLSVRTPRVEKQLDAARGYAVAAGGYAGDENTVVDGRGHAASSIQLRVPAAAYDRVLTELAGLGTLLDRNVGVADVTGQVVDVESRIASQRASVTRVRALMNQAQGLSDVVTLESELSTRESALEALEAQQASLKSRTDLATITLRLTEPPAKPAAAKPVRHDGFGTSVGHALGDGWHGFYVTVRALLIVLSVALPFLVVIVLGWLAYRLARRRLPVRAPVPEPRRARMPGRSWETDASRESGEAAEPGQPEAARRGPEPVRERGPAAGDGDSAGE